MRTRKISSQNVDCIGLRAHSVKSKGLLRFTQHIKAHHLSCHTSQFDYFHNLLFIGGFIFYVAGTLVSNNPNYKNSDS